MKNLFKLLSICAVFFLSLSAQAQTTFGVRAGVNIATINFDSEGGDFSPDSRVGLTISGLANIGITESFSIQPELQFIQKGYKLELEFAGITSEQTVKLNYLEVPIHAKYQFGQENVGGFLLLGPSIGFALGGEVEECEGENCTTIDIEFDDNDGFNRFELGLSFGAGLSIGSNIFVDLRYVLGLTSLTEDNTGGKATNRGFQVGVGYLFGGE